MCHERWALHLLLKFFNIYCVYWSDHPVDCYFLLFLYYFLCRFVRLTVTNESHSEVRKDLYLNARQIYTRSVGLSFMG